MFHNIIVENKQVYIIILVQYEWRPQSHAVDVFIVLDKIWNISLIIWILENVVKENILKISFAAFKLSSLYFMPIFRKKNRVKFIFTNQSKINWLTSFYFNLCVQKKKRTSYFFFFFICHFVFTFLFLIFFCNKNFL